MSHSIQLQIRSIARQARRLLLVHGICQFGLVIISTAFLAGLIDYVLRLQDQGIRLIISSMFGLTLIWSFRRFVLPSFHRRFGEVEVAEHVERRFPELGDQLSSSLSFLIGDQTANQAESATLRQSVISQTEALVRQLRLQECLDRRSTRRAVITCLLMLLAIGCICLMDREGASLAVRRLATPWSRDAWPRRNSLEIVNPPERIALGQDFEIEVVDIHDRLPKDATIHLWFEGDRESEIETALARRGEGRFHYTRNNVARAFKYRVTGGDDDSMEWKSLQVVEPVRIVDFRAVVEPPTYSGIKASESEIAAIRVLEGSRVTLHGRTDRPLRAARAIVSIDGVKEVIEAEVNAKENAFVVTSLPTGTACKGQYWIELEEADGVVSEGDTRASWEIVPDRSPLVTVVTPTNDAYFTPMQFFQFESAAADDLAIQGLMVHVGEATIPLYVGSESPPACDELPEQADVREVTRSTCVNFNSLPMTLCS